MDISAITAPSTTSSSSSSSGTTLDTDDFYQLLAAQIQYQDPLGDSDSSGSSSSSTSYITQLAVMSATSAVQSMTEVENYAMATAMTGKTVAYTSTSTSSSGTASTTTKTGTVEAADFTGDTPRVYIASTSDGTTTGEWVEYTSVTEVYADDVTDSSSSSTTTT